MYVAVSQRVIHGRVPSSIRRSHLTFVLPSQPGQQQTHREALLRTQRLAVLRPDDKRVVHAFSNRDASRHQTRVAALREKPLRAAADADFARAASPAGRRSTPSCSSCPATCCGVSAGFGFPNAPLRQRQHAVAGALDEVRARDLRESLEVPERE